MADKVKKTKKRKTTTKINKKKESVKKVKEVKNTIHKSDTMAKEDNKLMLLIAYILGVFAIIIYLIKKEDSFVKFHSLQSIVLNIAVFVFFIIISIVMVPLTMVSGGICGIAYLPLMVLPFLVYIYILYKVITTGDVEVPYLTAFVKKNMKQYF